MDDAYGDTLVFSVGSCIVHKVFLITDLKQLY